MELPNAQQLTKEVEVYYGILSSPTTPSYMQISVFSINIVNKRLLIIDPSYPSSFKKDNFSSFIHRMCAYNVTPIVYNCNFSINFYCYVVLVFHKTVPVLLKEQPETLYEVAVSEKKK